MGTFRLIYPYRVKVSSIRISKVGMVRLIVSPVRLRVRLSISRW